jgi:hypothetical protein
MHEKRISYSRHSRLARAVRAGGVAVRERQSRCDLGFNEVPTLSARQADFDAKINRDGTQIDCRLTYSAFTNVLQAHLHLGRQP